MKVQATAQKPESIPMRVISEVADVRDVDPIDLSPPLGSVVDADALDALATTGSDTPVVVEFSYAGCQVAVRNDEVDVQPGVDID